MTRDELIEAMRQEICQHQCGGELAAECTANPNCLCLKDAQAGLMAIEAAGCLVVPVEPTRAMLHVTLLSSGHRGIGMDEKRDIYRWMLKATPFSKDSSALTAMSLLREASPTASSEEANGR